MNTEIILQKRPDKITFELNNSEFKSLYALLMMADYGYSKTDTHLMAWFITEAIYKRVANRIMNRITGTRKFNVKHAEAIALKIVLNTIIQGNLIDPHAQMVLDKIIAIIDQKLV